MTPTARDTRSEPDHDRIVDHVYEIALEPSLLEDFINFWAEAEATAPFESRPGRKPGEPGANLDIHLARAATFLQRSGVSSPDLSIHLEPYENFAAFVINGSLVVEATNQAANTAFGATEGAGLDALDLPEKAREHLERLALDSMIRPDHPETLLKVRTGAGRRTTLFRVSKVGDASATSPAALVVSTQFQWHEAIGSALANAFDLTPAEQDVTRLLSEGHDAKTIADLRGTSVGTVRAQIKSTFRKMDIRSQSDLVRLATALAVLLRGSEMPDEDAGASVSVQRRDWLSNEVWKPFRTLTLPDGRKLTYHDMGPPSGNPILLSHMGSCMVRWTPAMVALAFRHELRVICPIRAGFGHSDQPDPEADIIEQANADTIALLDSLGLGRLPYAVQGTDFAFAAHLVTRQTERVSAVLGIGARPCLPGGRQVEGAGRWQRFFVWTARHNPRLVRFASNAVMAMSHRIGSSAMLRRLCKESPADLALLDSPEVAEVLEANLELMSSNWANAGRAFAMEYIAFQRDWSAQVVECRHIPVHVFIAEEDPTIDVGAVRDLAAAYPWMKFEIMPNAGLALMYQHPDRLVAEMAKLARSATGN